MLNRSHMEASEGEEEMETEQRSETEKTDPEEEGRKERR